MFSNHHDMNKFIAISTFYIAQNIEVIVNLYSEKITFFVLTLPQS